MQVGRDGAPGPCAKTGCAVVWPQPAGCSVEGCGDAVGDADHHLVAPARHSMHTHTSEQPAGDLQPGCRRVQLRTACDTGRLDARM